MFNGCSASAREDEKVLEMNGVMVTHILNVCNATELCI